MIDSETYKHRLEKFKSDLKVEPVGTLLGKYITHGSSAVFDDDSYYKLKECIASRFNIHTADIYMVGSAKLGFSLKESRRFESFCDTSDIDIAIVSSELFHELWKEIFIFQRQSGWWQESNSFRKYMFKGWIRPDYLPNSSSFEIARNWWDFFLELTSSGDFGPYSIKAGLYHSLFFLDAYQEQCISECKSLMEA